MTDRKSRASFTAYSGTRDTAETCAGERGRGASRSPVKQKNGKSGKGRLRFALLLTCLFGGGTFLSVRYADTVSAYVVMPDIEMPRISMPDMDRPVINRPISTVKMENPLYQVREMDVRTVLARHLDDGFFGLDVRGLKQELEENPWIEQVSIRRLWPDTLSITVREEVPIARWGEAGLLNQSGSIFTPPVIEVEGSLPALTGPDGMHRQVMEQYQLFSQLLLPSGLRINELALSERGAWTLAVNQGLTLNLGREHLMERLQRFVTIYDRKFQHELQELAAIDLRYNNGLSVRRKEPENGVASL